MMRKESPLKRLAQDTKRFSAFVFAAGLSLGAAVYVAPDAWAEEEEDQVSIVDAPAGEDKGGAADEPEEGPVASRVPAEKGGAPRSQGAPQSLRRRGNREKNPRR